MDVGDLTERKELRKKLKCQNYRWILDNVYTQSVMRSMYVNMGQIADESGTICFDSYGGGHNGTLKTYQCHETPTLTQGMVYFQSKQLARAEDNCIRIGEQITANQTLTPTYKIIFFACDAKDENQKWELVEKVCVYFHFAMNDG